MKAKACGKKKYEDQGAFPDAIRNPLCTAKGNDCFV
jgi:hypothetical protein